MNVIEINAEGQIGFDSSDHIKSITDETENLRQWATAECRTEQGKYFADEEMGLNPLVWKIQSSVFDKTLDIKRACEKYLAVKEIIYENKVFKVEL